MPRRKGPSKGRLAIHKRTSPGASPGTLVADPSAKPEAKVRVLTYGPDSFEDRVIHGAAGVKAVLGRWPVTWIDIEGVGEPGLIEELGKTLGLHPLALEDTINLYQRPKVDEYPTDLFVVVRMATFNDRIGTEQLSLFLGDGFLVTVQGDRPGDCLDPVRRRLETDLSRIRNAGADYLAYAIIDAVIDNYFPILDEFGEGLERLEDELLVKPVPHAPQEIQRAKQDLLVLRRAVLPLRDVLASLSREDNPFVKPDTRVFLRDCSDHVVQLTDVITTYRELAGGLMELHLSGVSNRMNEVMKFLTLVSTIFIPLTFIVGVYGMNFDPHVSPLNMPELEWYYGYPVVMAFMAIIAAGLVYYFKRKGWLAPPS